MVTIGISSTEVTAENYGYMAPIKASLEASVRYLAKSFSNSSEVRVQLGKCRSLKNKCICWNTRLSGYYLYAEKLTFRKRSLQTKEVTDLAIFLLSERSSGITALSWLMLMGLNYFDQVVDATMQIKSEFPNVNEGMAYDLPEQVVSSEELEKSLSPFTLVSD